MLNLKTIRKSLAFIGIVGVLASAAGSTFADTVWEQNHPRREQVNKRLADQNARIEAKVRTGQMSVAKAAQLQHQVHRIRREERIMASHNGGHITKLEQRALNQHENRVSRKIGA